MSQHTFEAIRRLCTDDRALQELVMGMWAYPAVLLAHQLGLFSILDENPRTPMEVARALGIEPRPAEALLTASASLGLLRTEQGRYGLTPMAEDYLLARSPTYFGPFLDLIIAANPACSFENVKKAVLTNSPQVSPTSAMYRSPEPARAFYRGMYGHSIAAALEWPGHVDLSGSQVLLDIGGGSGVHSIGAALKWPNLRAVVFDLPNACAAADEYVATHGLQQRVQTQAGDMWQDPFPAADVHLYSLVFPDWPLEKCRALLRKSFDTLRPGNRIIIHEMLYSDDKTGPLPPAGFSVMMLVLTSGQFYSGRELSDMLTDTGFRQVEVKPTFGYWGIVTGRKP
jgi:hypothetical protein